jgi:hypothetical protein
VDIARRNAALSAQVAQNVAEEAALGARPRRATGARHRVDTSDGKQSRQATERTFGMRKTSTFGTAFSAAALCAGLAFGGGVAEAATQPQAAPPTRRGTEQWTTTSMARMMQDMQRIMAETSGMMGRGMGTGQGMGMTGGQGMMQGQGQAAPGDRSSMTMGMSRDLNDLSRSMNRTMHQMQAMMNDRDFTGNTTLSRDLHQMERNMGTMMHGLDGIVHDVQKLQPPTAKKP